jgi:flagellar biosynthesis GTPase FlhF
MTSFETETTTYRAGSLEELLPQIREELGPDAVIVRQREGIVGGVGGFFGKRCVEVEARPAVARPSVPPRAVVDAYDTGDRPVSENGSDGNALLDTLMAQASPFGDELAQALSRTREDPEPAPPLYEELAPEPAVERPSALADIANRPLQKPAYLDLPEPVAVDEAPAARAMMEAAGIPPSLIDEVLAEVDQVLRPFEPLTSYRELTRRALARRIVVAHGWRTKRRTLALIGLAGSGKTLTAAKLSQAYARAGRSVAALSLESARTATHLGDLTDRSGVELEIADSPQKVELARRKLRAAEVVVVDTPALTDPVDGRRIGPLLRMLDALKADETHLLLPATTDAAEARAFMASLLRHMTPSRLVVTHADARPHMGSIVGLSLTEKVPVSFVVEGDRPVGGIGLAEPDALARMVLA